MDLLQPLPPVLSGFVLVTLFSLLVGLSQRRIHSHPDEALHTFGTDRTFTFIGILGFILWLLGGGSPVLFAFGGCVLAMVMGISYYYHIRNLQDYGATTIFVALITYCLGPLTLTQPLWMVLLIVVTVLVFTELKDTLASISAKFDRFEFITLAKFLVIAGVILPVVPDVPFIAGFSITPYRIWMAVVVISSISYASYLLKKFVFPDASIILAGILGGLYSSTATTIILARKSRKEPGHLNQYMAGIIFATAVMYLRILILIVIFSQSLFLRVWPFFTGLFLLSVLTGLAILYHRNRLVSTSDQELRADKNPLEFKVALIFAALFVAFTLVTHAVMERYGTPGLNLLSWIVGLVDIDPFLINLFQGKQGVVADAVIRATFQAIVSNNILKMAYGLFFSGARSRIYLVPGFLLIIALTLATLLFF